MLLNKTYFYKSIILLLVVATITACSKPKTPDGKEVKAIKNFITDSCPVNKNFDSNQDIIIATLYYKSNNVSLSVEDKLILQQVINLFQACNNKILLIGYASNKEAKESPNLAANVSYLRALGAYQYLQKSIPINSIYFQFCSNLRNKYQETNNTATFGNQRVEVVMLAKGISQDYLTCLSGNK